MDKVILSVLRFSCVFNLKNWKLIIRHPIYATILDLLN
jgi:hypothetical protein